MLQKLRRAPFALCMVAIISLLSAGSEALAQASGQPAVQALPKGVTKHSTVEGITEYRLENGLKVLLFPDASKPTAVVNMTYLVGSRHENYGETGMAHLLEHLVFKGTPKNPKIDAEFNKRGMRINGSTSLDRTNYFELFQASDDNLQWAIELEADRMVNSFIARKDLDAEMTVVRNEMESGENNPFRVLLKRMQSVMFDWHNNGKSTIGNRSDVENVKIENLQAFYRRYYQPDNAVLLVAGKIDEAKTLGWIAQAFASIPKPTRILPVAWTVEPTQDGERSFYVRRKGDIQMIAAAYHVPAALHKDADALDFAVEILNDTPNGRLHKALVTTGKATQIFGLNYAGAEPGLAMLGAVVKAGEPLEPVRDALIAAVEDFAKNPPTKEEMERTKRKMDNRLDRVLANPESIGVGMSEAIALGDWRLFFAERERIEKITSADVAAAAAAYFRRDNRTVGAYVPENQPQRAEIPAAPSAAEVLKDFKPKVRTDVAEVFDPSHANLDARTQRSKIGGLDVAMLSKKNRGETVSVTFNLRWGDEKSLFGKRTVAYVTSGMLMRGNSKYTREQLADEMQRLKITGGIYRFETTRPNLNEALRLVAQILKEPSFPQAGFDELVRQYLVNLEATRNDPAAIANRAIGEVFNRYPKGDYRAFESLDESIAALKAVKLDDLKAFHKAFYGATRGEIAIVGDFDPAAAAKVIDEAFASWKSPTGYSRLVNRYADIAPMSKTINTPDKENANYVAQVAFRLKDSDADYPALVVGANIFGGSNFDSRLMGRIREKDGLSYGIYGSLRASVLDEDGGYSITGITAPQNLAKVDAAVREELTRAATQGFTADELSKAKSGLKQQYLQARAQDPNVSAELGNQLYFNRTYAWNRALEEKINALTLEQLNTAWRSKIDPAKFSVVMAGDEAKAKAATAK